MFNAFAPRGQVTISVTRSGKSRASGLARSLRGPLVTMSNPTRIRISESLVRYLACCACAGDGGECEGHAFEVVREGRATFLVGDVSGVLQDLKDIANGHFFYPGAGGNVRAAARRALRA
jgi:hypothetical protein